MSGTMQGLGATGTGYGGSGNSLLQQLLMRHYLSGGALGGGGGAQMGYGSFMPQGGPMQGLDPTQRTQGMNPVAQAQPVQMQGANTGLASAMGGGGQANLQNILNAIRNQQAGGGGGGGGANLNATPGVLTGGIGNLLQGYNWGGTPGSSMMQGLTNQAQGNVQGGAAGL
jgi:hypothetical protein